MEDEHVTAEAETTETVLLNQNGDPAATSVVGNVSSHPPYPSYMKYVTLVWLALHSVGGVILKRHVRTTPGPRFINSTFVWICEIQKTILSLILIFGEERSLIGGLKTILNKILLQPQDTIKMVIPALIYTVQNNLNLEALSNLDAATFMVINQLKIFTTAVFTVILLHRRLGLIQWFALTLLFLGVCFVQTQNLTSKTPKSDINASVGFLIVIGACICSGLAGVYFEKVLKGSQVSLWIREFQLAGLSVILSSLAVYILNGAQVKTQGILLGYTGMVWITTIVHSAGGLIVALVIKYADNILKGFASSSAIILSCIVSIVFFAFQLTGLFALGLLFVIFSIFLYAKPELILHVPIINSFVQDKPIFFEEK